ncbi:MAG: bifunctional 4-hydroxy-2-oxoglutarate aldolase/2-dehydro-3-deoxy-phosphogluconate aldolase [Pseudomonadota bacterium]
MLSVREICARAPMIPVLVLDDAADAGALAQALVGGGLPVLEVTLRTPAALDVIREMRRAVPEAVVGAGTLRTPADLAASIEAGAQFGVSPGGPARLLDAVAEAGLPFLPGAATPTEAMDLADRGFETLKFFPAEPLGGTATLSAWASPLAGLGFCPTGGITAADAPGYLALPNVLTVGGSWVTPKDLVATRNWAAIGDLARAAVRLLA